MVSRTRLHRILHSRLLKAGFVTLLVALGGSLAFTVGSASSDNAPAQTPFALPAPHLGDHGSYLLRTSTATDLGTIEESDEAFAYSFRWNHTGQAYDEEGRHRWTNRLDVRESYDPYEPHTLHLDQATGTSVAVEQFFAAKAENGGPTYKESRYIFFGRDATPVEPCGPRNRLQDATDAPLHAVLFPACTLPGVYVSLDDRTFDFLGTREHGGHLYQWYRSAGNASAPAAVSDGHTAHPDVTVTFRDDIPYPVFFTIEDADDTQTLRLAAYGRGSEPLGDRASDESPLPATTPADATPWLLDDQDVAHPYPLSQAYADATSDPRLGVGDYVRAHPDAVMVQARYNEGVRDAVTYHQWSFLLQDGNNGIFVTYEASQAGFAPHVLPTGRLNGAAYPMELERAAPAAPEQAPSVASMLHAAAHAAKVVGTDTAFNGWGFHAYDTGNGTQHWIEVGEYRDTMSPLGAPLAQADIEMMAEGFVFDAEGRLIGMLAHSIGSAPPTREEPKAAPLEPLALDVTPVSPWTLPPAQQAAGIGLLALIAGALYWVWPTLKQGAATALFSRIERPKALDSAERARVAAVIDSEPGLHAEEIVRRSGLSRGAVRHHLAKLVDTGIVQAVHGRRYTCYHASGTDRRLAQAAPLLRADSAQRLLAHLGERPGASVTEAAHALGTSKQAIAKQANRLEEAGLLQRRRDGRHLRLVLTPTGDALRRAT